jgi:hypothetical protein
LTTPSKRVKNIISPKKSQKMLNYAELVARIQIERNNPRPNGVIIDSGVGDMNFQAHIDFTTFNGFPKIESVYPVCLVQPSELDELFLHPKVKGLIYATKSPFLCDDWSHTILTNDVIVVANCAKAKHYVIDTDFKQGFLSYIGGYVACIY